MKYFEKWIRREFFIGEDGEEHEDIRRQRSWWAVKEEIKNRVKLDELKKLASYEPTPYAGYILVFILLAPMLAFAALENIFPQAYAWFQANSMRPLIILASVIVSGMLGCSYAFRSQKNQVRAFCLRLSEEFPGILQEIREVEPDLAKRLDRFLPKQNT